MKRLSIMIFSLIILTGLLAACATSDFNKTASVSAVEQAFAAQGLQVCTSQDVSWPGDSSLVSGKYYEIGTNCAQSDPNKPGARAWVLEFDSPAARNAALRRFMTEGRRSLGTAFAWTNGPLVIAVEGGQSPEVVAAIKQAAINSGAQ
jgi:hypothetical protein